jgi:hypothetical protein
LAYGCLSTSFSGLERDVCRGGAVFLYLDLNAFTLVFALNLQFIKKITPC